MMKDKFLYILSALLLCLVSSCNHNDAVIEPGNMKMTRVVMEMPDSEHLESVSWLFFKHGGEVCSGRLPHIGTEVKVPLEGEGNLYMIANEGGRVSLPVPGGMTEMEWKEVCIGMDETGNPFPFMIGKTEIDQEVAEYAMVMKRGVARFDVIYAFQGTQVKSLTLKGMAGKSYLVERTPLAVPSEAGKVDLKISGASLNGQDRKGICYAYEQINPEATVEVEMPDGTVHSAKLPQKINRNKVYTIQIGRDGSLHSITVEDWHREDETLIPDRNTALTVNRELTSQNDALTILPEDRGISLNYLPAVVDVAVNCGEELEYVGGGGNWIEIAQLNAEAPLLAERNVFRLTKKLVPPGFPIEEIQLQFRRKGLTEVYDEDCLKVVLERNEDTLEGLLDFNNDKYECDFGRYIDGTLGGYTVGEGRTLSLEVSESNPWVRLVPLEDNARSYQVQAGWKPNDPEADGRVQAAKLIVTDSKGNRQEYTIKRRNFGLPVIKLNDIWWCKFNAIGNSRNFEDQILCANDPTREAGKTVLDYLNSCSNEDFLKLWNSAYAGNSGEAMTVVYQEGRFVLQGYQLNETVHINHLDAKSLAPDGYEMPAFEDYQRILGSFQVPESVAPFNPENGGREYRCEIFMSKRTGVVLGTMVMPEMRFITIRSVMNKGTEPLTLYGVGSQWNNNGINANWLLFANYNPQTTGWLYKASGGKLEHNEAAANNTRVVRFRKSPVEYIYGE